MAPGPWLEMLLKMHDDPEISAVFADISVSKLRAEKTKFSFPITSEGLKMMVKRKEYGQSMWGFIDPFSPSVWLVTLLFLFILCGVTWFLETFGTGSDGDFKGSFSKGLGGAMWFSMMTPFGLQDKAVKTVWSRIIAFAWAFSILIITSSYTANMAAYLTAQQLDQAVDDIRDLMGTNSQIGVSFGSAYEQLMRDNFNFRDDNLVPANGIDAFDRLTSEEMDVYVNVYLDTSLFFFFSFFSHQHKNYVASLFLSTKGLLAEIWRSTPWFQARKVAK